MRPLAPRYRRFAELDGSHPLRDAVPGGYVDYETRRRPGRVLYFNFDLAREMGLIPSRHPDRLEPELERAVLDTFSVVIVNEWDRENGVRVPRSQRRPGRYMATRYLQLQHPSRTGRTSGDGRGLWFGTLRHRGTTWDVAGCGTGVTRLCPATALEGRFFRTGNDAASYGCGTASHEEGLATALMSETFHRSGFATERTLAVISCDDGFAIHVRAARNLLRPSHLFLWLKQGDRERLRGAVELHARRMADNGDWPRFRSRAARYRRLADDAARTFGRLAATFEREYVFCWLDWDGDNILLDGGIIDYGSVRQFGLYHAEYRYDDGPRWSTTLAEQRRKARELVRTMVQVREFLLTGRKPPLRSLNRDPALRLFDREYRETRDRLLLRGTGLPDDACRAVLRHGRDALRRFDRAHAHFERARSARGPVQVADGVSWNAIFSTRDVLRELPERVLTTGGPLPAREFVDLAASTYASRRDRRLTPHRRRMASLFQRAWLELIEVAARRTGRTVPVLLVQTARRSRTINRRDRITGDAIAWGAARLARQRRRLGPRVGEVIRRFVREQSTDPADAPAAAPRGAPSQDVRRALRGLMELTETCRYGL